MRNATGCIYKRDRTKKKWKNSKRNYREQKNKDDTGIIGSFPFTINGTGGNATFSRDTGVII